MIWIIDEVPFEAFHSYHRCAGVGKRKRSMLDGPRPLVRSPAACADARRPSVWHGMRNFDDAPSGPSPPRTVWSLVAAGFVIWFIVVGGGLNTVSVFINAIARTTDWSRSSLSFAVSVGAVSAALTTPLVGLALDRFGVRLPMMAGLVLLGLGLTLAVGMRDPWQFVVANLFLGPGFAATALMSVPVAVTLYVSERTAFALGLVMSGSSIGALVLAPVAQAGVDAIGWRATWGALAAAMFVVTPPLIAFAMPRGRLLGASRGYTGAPTASVVADLRQPGVMALAAVMLFPSLTTFGVSVHLVPYLVGTGHSGRAAAAALGGMIGISAIGKVAGGWIGDRIGPLRTLRVNLVIWSAAVALLPSTGSASLLLTFVVLYGLSLGAHISLVPALARIILGTQRFGTLFGILQLGSALGSALGPLSAGLLFDATGTYAGAMALWLGALVLAAITAYTLRLRDELVGAPAGGPLT
jgi:predicted MFS family arabinose efflux permease